jgi:hypothetical protein
MDDAKEAKGVPSICLEQIPFTWENSFLWSQRVSPTVPMEVTHHLFFQ